MVVGGSKVQIFKNQVEHLMDIFGFADFVCVANYDIHYFVQLCYALVAC